MGRNGEGGTSTQLLLYRFHNVVRHKGFAIVFADMAIGHEAGFAAQFVLRKRALPNSLIFQGEPGFPGPSCLRPSYLFSAPIVLVVVLVLVLVLGWDRGGFAQDGIGMNGESKRRSFAGSREKRTRTIGK